MKTFPREEPCFHCGQPHIRRHIRDIYHFPDCLLAHEAETNRGHDESLRAGRETQARKRREKEAKQP